MDSDSHENNMPDAEIMRHNIRRIERSVSTTCLRYEQVITHRSTVRCMRQILNQHGILFPCESESIGFIFVKMF